MHTRVAAWVSCSTNNWIMPELPEIETIRNVLIRGKEKQPSIIGKTIVRAEILWERTIATPPVEEFKDWIVERSILNVRRRGKYLILDLSDGCLIFHLRMSGDVVIEKVDQEIAPHYRLILDFGDGWRLAFDDTRKFGRVWLVENMVEVTHKLGPEPLIPEFTSLMLYQMLKSHHRQLKPLLMDQHFLAGLGNIYTDEALHVARLHPLIRSDRLNEAQVKRLWSAIRHVLSEGIEKNGASIDWVYKGGEFQNYFRVYHRAGKPCLNCGTPIERLVVGQRGTHICPKCQALPD